MTTLNCLNCQSLISKAENLTIYRQSLTCSHLSIKLEKRNLLLSKLLVKEDINEKKNRFLKSILLCIECNAKLGSETLNGPNSEAMFCFKAEAIILGGSIFKKAPKWFELSHDYPDIEMREPATLYGSSSNSLQQPKEKKTFFETIFPDHHEVSNFNISSLIDDQPRKYQIELCLSALFSNSIIYLQTGGGKTLVATMVTF